MVETGKDIDLTNYSTIRAKFTNITAVGEITNSSYIGLYVINRNITYLEGAEALAWYDVTKSNANDVIIECDVSNISGSYDIALVFGVYNKSAFTMTGVLESVEME